MINYPIHPTLCTIEDYYDLIACKLLTDYQYELEYQGLFINDKIRYLAGKGFGLYTLNNIQ